MSDLSREEEIRVICLEQAVILCSPINTRTYAPAEVVRVAKEFETYVRGLYKKGDAVPIQVPEVEDEFDPDEEQVVMMRGKEDRDPTN